MYFDETTELGAEGRPPVAASRARRLRTLLLVLLGAGLSGCTDYYLETTVNPDGSGLRSERVEVTENDDVEATPAEYPLVMHTTEVEGWSHRVEVKSDGDTVHVFTRRLPVRNLASWSELSDRFRIDGPVPVDADERLGYVRLGDVRFRNTVRVGRGEVSDGTTTFSYRETFAWDWAVDALVEYFMGAVDSTLAARFPRLSQGERGQIVGFLRARYGVALSEGLLGEDADEDQILSEAARRTAEQAVKMVRVEYPPVTQENLEALIKEVILDDDRFLAFADRLPGLDLAFNANVEYRLNLPGTVTDSNAHKRDGKTLVWVFGPADALLTPVEIYAESRLNR